MAKSKKSTFIGKECVACGGCVKKCPIGAISIYKGMYAAVDKNKCIGCAKCIKACPAGVIELMEREVKIA